VYKRIKILFFLSLFLFIYTCMCAGVCVCAEHSTHFDSKPIYLPGIFGKMMMKVMKWHETNACGCIRTMFNGLHTFSSLKRQIKKKNVTRKREKREMANGRSMYVWIRIYAELVRMFLIRLLSLSFFSLSLVLIPLRLPSR